MLFTTFKEKIKKTLGDDYFLHVLDCVEIGQTDDDERLVDVGAGCNFIIFDSINVNPVAYINPFHPKKNITKMQNFYFGDEIEEISNDIKVREIKQKMSDYGKVYLYAGYPIHYSIENRRINQINGDFVLFTKIQYSRCKIKPDHDKIVPLIDFVEPKIGEICPISYTPYPFYAIRASPCGHTFSAKAFYRYLKATTIKGLIVTNSNEFSKQFYKYIVTCPMCVGKESGAGGIIADAVRIRDSAYQLIYQWDDVREGLESNSMAICGLDTHTGSASFYTKDKNSKKVIYILLLIFLFYYS